MRSVEALLSELSRLNIKVWSDRGDLFYKCFKGGMTPALQQQLREKKADILAFLDESRAAGQALPAIEPSGKGPGPLSFAQQRLWFLSQLEGQGAAYNMSPAWKVDGQLDETALGKALEALMLRHEALRLCFPAVDGKPVTRLNEVYDPLLVIDLGRLPDAERESQVARQMADHAQAPFDLAHGPLFRVLLIKLGQQQILQFNIHHIISDGWSMGVLLRDWSQLYDASVRNRPPRLTELSVQYADYVHWQRSWLKDEILERQLAYWKEKLDCAGALLELPADYPRPAVMSEQGGHSTRALSPELSRDIRQFCRDRNVTPFMALMAAFKVLLYRYSGQTDLTVGSPVANRSHSRTEDLVGLFANTLVFRTRINDGDAFLDTLDQVRQAAVEAYDHQDIPFEYLVERLNPSRSLSRTPLFQVMFVLQKAPREAFDLSGVTLSFLPLERPSAAFDLTLEITDTGESFVCDWEYSSALFRPETIAGMGEHFQVLLEGIIRNPSQTPAQLPLMTESGHRQLEAWNRTEALFPEDRTIVDLFEAQTERTPENIAVVHGERTLTYGELNRSANRLAHRLAAMGVGPEIPVGICMERSPEMIIGLLGILKAGGAYLPLDPQYPPARLRYMIEDAAAPIVLTQSHLLAQLPEAGAKILCLDQEPIDSCPDTNPARRSTSGNLAYVIYTSGSSGTPKGVMIEHSAVANYAHSAVRIFSLSSADRVLQFASISFDVAVEEIFPILTCGGRLILRKDALLESNSDFLAACRQNAITVLSLPTAYWRQLISSDEGRKDWPESIRMVIIGGEAASIEHVRLWQETLRVNCRLINAYGPTEATVSATMHPLTASADRVLIGAPIPNTRIYILDPQQNPVPAGIPGELCIAGSGLARGYLNLPELTAERFVTIQIAGEHQRIYRTGDKARRLSNGDIDYLGRMDDQVQLRGFRIEPSEIEAALMRHSAVREAVVAPDGGENVERLIAYVSLGEPLEEATQALGAWLRERLPDYMLPAACVVLDKLPLTSAGKVDKKALPAPENGSVQNRAAFIEPETRLERKIAQVWQDVLKLENVGIHDNFFDLGGHSLLLIQVQSRLQAFVDQPLPAVKLFQYPTIHSLAAHLAGAANGKSVRSGSRSEGAGRPALDDSRDIAIIGMAGRFPGARNIDALWDNLRQGIESIRFFTDEELLKEGVNADVIADPAYVKAHGVLDGVDLFDAEFFGYASLDAERLDPQERLFLETAWTALENAGYDATRIDFPVGVYAGAGMSGYFLNHVLANRQLHASAADFQTAIGGDKDFIATRTAYKLGLKGPAITLNTACSTSLVAVHTACRSLLSDECDMALAGGVSISFPQTSGYLYQDGMIGSPDGRCRAFDARAGGTVGGSGVGVVVLKRLGRALADGDTIHAVIKGSAVNNDGRDKVGYTAPSIVGQAAVIEAAMTGLDYESISYVEAHGTGTQLGDPIEVEALTRAFRTGTQKRNFCALGSVKTNLGHLDTAAGVVGLIKTVLSLKHKEIPPSLHFTAPNPQIDFAGSPFFVNARLRPWQAAAPRRAGVSSFGIGGTNAHLVLEEPPEETRAALSEKPSAPAAAGDGFLFCLSARTEKALGDYRRNLIHYLETHPEADLADLAYTLNSGRKAFACRGAFIGKTSADCVEILRNEHAERFWRQTLSDDRERPVAFVFQRTEPFHMAGGLYEREPLFRATVDECARRLTTVIGLDIRRVLFASGAPERELNQTEIAQPALFVAEYALAKLYMARGVSPDAMIGRGVGEYVAASLSGVFLLEEALDLAILHGRLMHALPPGAMPDAPGTMEPLEAFRGRLARIRLNSPQIPFISSLTGTWITNSQAIDPDYWRRRLLQPARFLDGLDALLDDYPNCALVEMAPGRELAAFARQRPGTVVIDALPDADPDQPPLLANLGKLWLAGAPVHWTRFYERTGRRRRPIPTYPFERKRYWLEPEAPQGSVSHASLDLSDWFYLPVWQREKAVRHDPGQTGQAQDWLIFTDELGLGSGLAARLRQGGVAATIVGLGAGFTRTDRDAYAIDPGRAAEYDALFDELAAADRLPSVIVHLWGVGGAGEDAAVTPDLSFAGSGDKIQQRGFYSLLAIARALWKHSPHAERRIEVVTDQVQAVTGTERLYPEKATVLGPVKVIPQEYPNISCRCIDIELPSSPAGHVVDGLVDRLLDELGTTPSPGSPLIALRGAYRWEQSFAPLKLPQPGDRQAGLRKNGVYLISGGMGGLGMAFSRYLAKTVQARLVLVSRSSFPPKEEWASFPPPTARTQSPPGLDAGIDREIIERMASELESELGFKPSGSLDMDRATDELCAGYIVGYVARYIDTAPGRVYSRDDLTERLQILPKFEKFFGFMLDVLAEDRIVRLADGRVEFLERPHTRDVATLRASIERNHPDFIGTMAVLDHCVSRYPEALTGKTEAISVLYPQGDTALLNETGRGGLPQSADEFYIRLLRDVIAKIIDSGPRKKLRILEVGGGNGGLTRSLLTVFNRCNAEYHFTDLGNFFVVNALKRAEEAGDDDWMRFNVLDISKAPEEQGYDETAFDMIVGFNVVHATPDVRETLGYLKRLLTPGGLLCLVETVKRQRWTDMVWGLADGWWSFEDTDIRRNSPLLPVEQWKSVLAQKGFQEIRTVPGSPAEQEETEAALIIARAPAEISCPKAAALLPGETRDQAQQVRLLRELEAYGGEVMVLSADVSDLHQMQSVHQRVKQEFGSVHGIIHAAGIEGGGAIQVQAAQTADGEFAPKIAGARVLEKVFLPDRPDFFMLCSSHNSLLGGAGQVGYCAANAFLDAYAQARAAESGTPTISINWDRWQGIGMAAKVEATHLARSREPLSRGLTAGEGAMAFHRILARGTLPQVVVSRKDFAASVKPPTTLAKDAAGSMKRAEGHEKEASAVADAHRRPDLPNAYVAPRLKAEQTIAGLWEEALGIRPVGVHDDFHELGGDSLIATQLASRIRQLLDVDLSVRDLLEHTTVASLAEYLTASLVAPGSQDDADDYFQDEL